MVSMAENDFIKICTQPAFVLANSSTPEDVGRAMLESGLQKQPFFIFNMNETFRRIQHFRDVMPRIKLFYAIKSNDSEMLLKFAISQGISFDCSSPGEIYKIRTFGVNPKRIIYGMPTKTAEQMTYARESGVRHTTFDSSYELKKLSEYWPESRLLIQVRVETDLQVRLGDTFDCDFQKEAITLLEEAANLRLKVVGVAFDVGSTFNSPESYVVGLKFARTLFDHEARVGRGMKILNLGEGFHSATINSIDKLSTVLNATLSRLFPHPNVQVIAVPNRYLCDSAFTLYCSINNVRRVNRDEKAITMVYINDGVYGSLKYSEKWHVLSKFKRTTEQDTTELEDMILWGPSCDPNDRIMANFPVRLPKCMPFDWLIFQNVGAYTISFSSKFSCLETPLVRSVLSMELWNMINDKDGFSPNDFIMNPDISSPLPATLPPWPSLNEIFEHSHTPMLKV